MSKNIIYNGRSYVRSGRKYYYNSSTRKYLHRVIWEEVNGEIPEGYQIHHIDNNPENNNIENLEMIKKGEHQKLHGAKLTEKEREWFRKNLNQNARPKAIEWHKSEKAKEWHRKHYEDMKDKLFKKIIKKCVNCGNEFECIDNGHNRFCSNKCKSAYRRKSGVDNVERACVVCNKTFVTNKYSKKRSCSRECAWRLRVLKI